MKRMFCSGTVDCTKCRFGHNGNESCSTGRDIKESGLQGCDKGVAIRKEPPTPVQAYKQQMIMAGLDSKTYGG